MRSRNVWQGLTIVAVGLVCAVARPGAAGAQAPFAIGVGPSFPVGDLGKYASTGFDVRGSFSVGIPYTPIALRFEGGYDQFGYDHIPGDAHVFSGIANAVYSFRGSVVRPYVIGGIGLYHAPHIETVNGNIITASNYTGGVNGGVGARIGGVAGLGVFAECRFHYAWTPHDPAEFFPLTIGITF
jgi:hypothetical protein